ncbi:signal peptidase II [Phycisphaeraceae bacterium D3-23]
MADAKPNDNPKASDSAVDAAPLAGKAKVLCVFLAVVVVLLAADLWLKSWSFANIAEVPIQVASGEDGPEVFRPGVDGEPEWVLLEPGPGGHPSTAIPPREEPVVVVPGLLDMQLVLNTGAVFGLGQGQRWLFIVVSVFATGVIFVLVWRSPPGRWCYPVALGMILSGALGNLYDRVRFSAVRDMLHMLPDTELWPWIFNLADVALVVGVIAVLALSWVEGLREKRAGGGAMKRSGSAKSAG